MPSLRSFSLITILSALLLSITFQASFASECQNGQIACSDQLTLATCQNYSWIYSKCAAGYTCRAGDSPACVTSSSLINPVFVPQKPIAVAPLAIRQVSESPEDTPTTTSTSTSTAQRTSASTSTSTSTSSSTSRQTSTSSSSQGRDTSTSSTSTSTSSQTTSTSENDNNTNTTTNTTSQTSTSSQASEKPQPTEDTPQCPDDFVAACKDSKTLLFCDNGSNKLQPCGANQLCMQLSPTVSAGCYDLPNGSINCSKKDEMLCVPALNAFATCNGSEYVFSGSCQAGTVCSLDSSNKAICANPSDNAGGNLITTIPSQLPYIPNSAFRSSAGYTISTALASITLYLANML